MVKGDIILITFPFTNLSGSKLRPAVVLIETTLDVTVSFITSQISWQEESDLFLMPTETNGIKKESLVRTSKIATIDKQFVKGKLGQLTVSEVKVFNEKLKSLLQLN